MEASPSFTVVGSSCVSFSTSFSIFCSFARVFSNGVFVLGPLFMGNMDVSFRKSSRLSRCIFLGGLERIATPAEEGARKSNVQNRFLVRHSDINTLLTDHKLCFNSILFCRIITHQHARVSRHRRRSFHLRTSTSYSREISETR